MLIIRNLNLIGIQSWTCLFFCSSLYTPEEEEEHDFPNDSCTCPAGYSAKFCTGPPPFDGV